MKTPDADQSDFQMFLLKKGVVGADDLRDIDGGSMQVGTVSVGLMIRI